MRQVASPKKEVCVSGSSNWRKIYHSRGPREDRDSWKDDSMDETDSRVPRVHQLLHIRKGAFMLATETNSLTELETLNEQKQPTLTDGFHLVVDALKLNGIDTIYGVAGIPITDLTRLAQAEGIRFIGFRHEQSAGNAAAIAGYLTQ